MSVLRRLTSRLAPRLHYCTTSARITAVQFNALRSVYVNVGGMQPRRYFLSPPGAKSGLISTQPSPDGSGTIPVVLVSDYKKIKDEFDAIVDVREANEVAEGMIPGAVHIPLGQILSHPNQSQFKGKQILVYCKAGIRSAKAVDAMQKEGIDAVNLGGGYLAWQGDR
jgi:rhodanese-related sulfurtransferase